MKQIFDYAQPIKLGGLPPSSFAPVFFLEKNSDLNRLSQA